MNKLCEERLAKCKDCLLARKGLDGSIRCDSTKYISPDGTKTSYLPKAGWIRGCSCRVDIKCQNPSAKCVRGLW